MFGKFNSIRCNLFQIKSIFTTTIAVLFLALPNLKSAAQTINQSNNSGPSIGIQHGDIYIYSNNNEQSGVFRDPYLAAEGYNGLIFESLDCQGRGVVTCRMRVKNTVRDQKLRVWGRRSDSEKTYAVDRYNKHNASGKVSIGDSRTGNRRSDLIPQGSYSFITAVFEPVNKNVNQFDMLGFQFYAHDIKEFFKVEFRNVPIR